MNVMLVSQFFGPLPESGSPTKSHIRENDDNDSAVKCIEVDSEDDLDYDMPDVEDEPSSTAAETDAKMSNPSSDFHLRPTNAPDEHTSAAVASECPLCTQPFSDNDELNAHIDWCLSREAIRSAHAEGDKREQKKPESRSKDPDMQEWWKVPPLERNARNQTRKRRKLGG